MKELKQGKLGERFVQAFEYAAEAHAGQRRKGKDLAYISHLMAVAALVESPGSGGSSFMLPSGSHITARNCKVCRVVSHVGS